MQDRILGRRDALERDDRAESEAAERRHVQPTDRAGEVAQRVRVRVAVGLRVLGGAHAAGVEHHHCGPAHACEELGARRRTDRSSGWKTDASTREKAAGGA